MGNLIMPKQTADLDRFYTSMDIFYTSYRNNSPDVTNKKFVEEMKVRIPDFQERGNRAKIVKQSEMTRYFGMSIHDYKNKTTQITHRGIQFYESYIAGDTDKCLDFIVEAIQEDSFGRNNTAIKSSDSHVDPPKLFVRGILDCNGISKKDLLLLLYYTHDLQLTYSDACMKLQAHRNSNLDTSAVVNSRMEHKYGDPKFDSFLKQIGFCILDQEKRYQLSPYIDEHYRELLSQLNIYNTIPRTDSWIFEDTSVDIKDTDCNCAYKETVHKTMAYEPNSESFIRQNSRTPSPNAKSSNRSYRYPTDTRLAKTALMMAQYRCEYDSKHNTFIGKNELPFMEAHHLVPMHGQIDFPFNLDCVENIVSLCPNCHSAVHYGNEASQKSILSQLFQQRKSQLEKIGIDVDFESLYEKYYR